MVNLQRSLFLAICLSLFSHIAHSQIVINSRFKPISYEEMMAPLVAAQQFHNQCISTLDDLLERTEQVEQYINKDLEPKTWRRYADYYNSIVDEYNRINKQGTDTGTRSRINNLKRNFSHVINGIINAYNRRIELANNQYRRIQSTNERCNRFFSEIPLDEFLDGNTPRISYYNN